MGLYEKVLVVDDAPEVIMLMRRVLDRESVETVAARNGLEAIQALKNNPEIRLVFIDAMMPKMDGYEALERIKRDFSFRDLKVCFLTSQRTPASVKRAVELGADDYLVKPIDASLVIKKCHDLLGNASSLSGFPTIAVDIPLLIPNSPFDVKIRMTKLSEIGAELESHVRLKDNAVIDLYSDKLPKELSDIEDFRIRFLLFQNNLQELESV